MTQFTMESGHTNPQFEGLLRLGEAGRESLDFGAAAAAFSSASALRPTDAGALLEWWSAAALSEQTQGLASRARQQLPNLATQRIFALQTAATLTDNGLSSIAFSVLSKLLEELPDDKEVVQRFEIERLFAIAVAHHSSGHTNAALQSCDTLLESFVSHHGATKLRAALLGQRGEAKMAMLDLHRLAKLFPEQHAVGRSYLTMMQYVPGISAHDVAEAHRGWAKTHMPNAATFAPGARADRGDVLRVGWLSPSFCPGLVSDLLLPALRHLKLEKLTLVLYDSGRHPPNTTNAFRDVADEWYSVASLDDAALDKRIRDDRIDILIELSGHSLGNRLRALASHPATVQISWLDYFHSTGSTAIDVFLSDSVISPPSLEHHYSERIMRLPSGRLCFSPPSDAPLVCDRHDIKVRFASFNRLNKLNDEVLEAWSEILNRVPHSVLRLKARPLNGFDDRQYLLQRFSRFGIVESQLELQGFGTPPQVFREYVDVDIALDPFPFSGCLTTFDALWMGVPVITRICDTAVSRQSASLITSIGLTDLISSTTQGYVNAAIELAGDKIRLSGYRSSLREATRTAVCDSRRHATELCNALRLVWHSQSRAETTRK